MVSERGVCTGWLGVTLAVVALGVVAGADVAANVGVGAGGTEATGTVLWQAAMERIPAKPKAIRICCLMIIDLLLRAGTRCHDVMIQVNQAPYLLSQLHSCGDRQTHGPALDRKYSKHLIGRTLMTYALEHNREHMFIAHRASSVR
jgi:hypothetical protein